VGIQNDLEQLRQLRQQVEQQLRAAQGFGERVRQLRLERRMTLDDLAGASGISRAYLSQIENGRVDPPRDDKVRSLEEVFGERPGVLIHLAHMARVPEDVRGRLQNLQAAFGRAEQTLEDVFRRLPPAGSDRPVGDEPDREGTRGADAGVADRQGVRGAVPVINRVAAGYPAEFTDLGYPAGVADEYIGRPPGLEDASAFAVRVVGDSMEPRYREGDIVLVSPGATIRSGDDCYVRFTPECSAAQGATFKRVYFDSETAVRLQPRNERYPPTVVPAAEVAGIYKAVFRYEAL